MLRHDVAADLRGDELAPGYVRPDYEGYCFAGVPATVADLLGASVVDGPRLPADAVPDGDFERVALVLVDGFGFEQFERHRRATPFLSRLAERARVTPLTSVFPSETTAAMTTYYLGAVPLEHGLLGWNVHLHLDDEDPAVEAALAERDCEALVLTRVEALAEGLWGPGEPSATFDRHCGDLVIVPRNLGVWHGGEPGELAMVGMHGRLAPEEMLVPFAIAWADRLQ